MSESGAVLREVGAIFAGGSVAGLSDAELLDRFVNRRDESAALAFQAIVVRHGPLVMRVCRASLRNSHDAEDAFQATFLVLAKKARSLWVGDSLAGWLANVASKTANRSRSRIARGAVDPLEIEPAGKDADLDLSDSRRTLLEEVQRLPARTRVPILLCYFEGMTHDAAAATLRLPVGTIHSRLARGRERLKSRLIRRGLAPAGAWLTFGGAADAAVSPTLRESTIKAAIAFVTSGALPAGTVPATVAALARGVIGTMFFTKLQMAGAIVLSASVLTAGAVVVAQAPGQGKAQDEPSPPKAVRAQEVTPNGSDTITTETVRPVSPPRREGLADRPLSLPVSGDSDSVPAHVARTSPRELLVRYRGAKEALERSRQLHKAAVVSAETLAEAQTELDLVVARIEDQRDDLQDLIELLRAQRNAREQEVEIARALAKVKRAEFDRLENLMRKGPNLVSKTEMTLAEAELDRAEAEIRARQAAVAELDVRIAQAERRLKGIEKGLGEIQADRLAT